MRLHQHIGKLLFGETTQKVENGPIARITATVAEIAQTADSEEIDEFLRMRLFLAKVQKVTDWLMDQFDISPRRYHALLILQAQTPDGGATVNKLGEQLGIQTNTCSELLRRMESDGLILRQRREDDRRVVMITLSETGEELLKRIAQADKAQLKALQEEFREFLG